MKMLGSGILIIIALFIVACSGVNDGSDRVTGVKLASPIQTCRMVDVPYEEQESYIEQEPYQDTESYQENLKYESVGTKTGTFLKGFDVWAFGEVPVRNVDSETGKFVVSQTFSTLNGGLKTYTVTQYIMPGETKTFRSEHDIDAGEDFNMKFVITPGTKTLTRTVTKFRDVTKYRTVTKIRQEQKCE